MTTLPIIPTLPPQLLEQIKAGNAILFLGAGASYGAHNGKKEKIPNGKQLSDLLAEKFLGKDYIGKDLAYVSELAISESSLFKVQHYIFELFKDFEPQPYHLQIPTFPWKAIFTTNYDLIIEKAYEKNKNRIQEIVPVFKNTPRDQIYIHEKSLPYYKIHGCITDINDKDAPLILTPDQFVNHKSKRDRLFFTLQEFSYDHAIIFVGFGMSDPDIRQILSNLDKNVEARTRSYLIGPDITDIESRLWEGKKITGLKMPFSTFLEELDKKIDSKSRLLGTFKSDHQLPIFNAFAISMDEVKPSENFIPYLQNNIEYIHSNLSAPHTDPKEFYKGYTDNWDPIIRNLDINRKVKDGIILEVFLDDYQHNSSNQYLYLIKGNAGSGKSVLLKRISFDAAAFDKFCIYLKEGASIQVQQILELANYAKDRIYLFIDDVSRLESEIVYLLNKAKKEKIKLTIIGAERSNLWNTECENLSTYLTEYYDLKYLHNAEINELLLQLEKHGALGTLQNKSQEERFAAFDQKAGRELLVALYEATNSKPFEQIIYDEYKSIANPKAQSLYLTVCIFHRLGTEARAGFISRVHGIGFNEFKEKLFKPLEFIVFDKKDPRINDFVYVTRNKLIAEIVFEKVLTSPQDRFDEYVRVLQNLNIDYDSDHIAFMSITNARKLLDIFPDPEMIRKIYRIATEFSENDAKLLQQQAIFEMNSPGGSIQTADRFLKAAFTISPNDPIISHSRAEMMLKKAERARFPKEFYSYIEETISISSTIAGKFQNNSHPYHTILKALLLKLKYQLDSDDAPSIERTIKDIEKAFVTSKQLYPNEEFILEIESRFSELMNEGNAKELLEKAFKLNKSSPFIALRLANYYEKEDEIKNSLEVVKESLELNPGDKELNFKYGMLLEKKAEPNYEDIKYYLRRAFTSGDSRYQAQFYYARCLYLTGEFKESEEVFKVLSNAHVAPDIKRKSTGLLKRNGKLLVFDGTITKIEVSYGFIRRDVYGDEMFFYRYDSEIDDWDSLGRGKKASFNIGFNYKGPVALNLKRKN